MGRGRIKTNAEQFAQAGDAWFADRFKAGEFPSIPSDNPDWDRWTQASFAPTKRSKHKTSLFAPRPKPDFTIGQSRVFNRKRYEVAKRFQQLIKSAEYRAK